MEAMNSHGHNRNPGVLRRASAAGADAQARHGNVTYSPISHFPVEHLPFLPFPQLPVSKIPTERKGRDAMSAEAIYQEPHPEISKIITWFERQPAPGGRYGAEWAARSPHNLSQLLETAAWMGKWRTFILLLPANLRYRVLEKLLTTHALPVEVLRAMLSEVWLSARLISTELPQPRTLQLFRQLAYVTDRLELDRPSEDTILFRGASYETRLGLSWTAQIQIAESFRDKHRDGAVFWAVVEPRRILARFDELQTDEHVVDTSGLDVRAFPTERHRPSKGAQDND